tara:strand:- start:366 stop:1502 length:1137 start_codon:yes stop_codon:yes gene_type:complete
MIVIIADDISGAAELAGVARAHGLRSEVHTVFQPDTNAEVIAIDTESRSLSPNEAAEKVGEIARQVFDLNPDWIYKKTDSVCRGNLIAEIEAIMEAISADQTVLIPANPEKARTIQDGSYQIEGVPLDQTAFAEDPEYPARTADVLQLLGSRNRELRTIESNAASIPGINVPDVQTRQHLENRAAECEPGILTAGAAEFFAALLRNRVVPRTYSDPAENSTGRTLFVCGSWSGWSGGRVEDCKQRRIPTVTMPESLFTHDNAPSERGWANEVCSAFDGSDTVMMAIGGTQVSDIDPSLFIERLSRSLQLVLEGTKVGRLCLEGGATAATVARQLNWHRLEVMDPIAFGIASMRVVRAKAPTLYIKPGSYPWPDMIWGC